MADKLACFLEAADSHNLTHIFKGQTKDCVLPDFLSSGEKEKLTEMYRLPEKEISIVAERSAHYLDAAARTPRYTRWQRSIWERGKSVRMASN